MRKEAIGRRKALRWMAAGMGAAWSGRLLAGGLLGGGEAGSQDAETDAYLLTGAEDYFLSEMERAACLYFYEQADAKTGQVLDRALNRNADGSRDPRNVSSIAATGFGLAGLCIADKRGYLPFVDIRGRVMATLDFHLNHMSHQHGFFSHYNDARTGERYGFSEISSIDTSILLCGVLTCRAYFSGAEDAKLREMATQLYQRVDWGWMLNAGTTFSMGWFPNTGFLAARWDHYCELMMLYLLAIGSPTHPVPAELWAGIVRPRVSYGPYVFISDEDPLFVHQFSHAFFDFRGKRDAFADYFHNSVVATEAHKDFCLSLNRGYTEDSWGVTSSDWEHGYAAWGGPPLIGPVDGAVVPCATAGSLPFLPEDCLRVLQALKRDFGRRAWGRYGFCDCLHPQVNWYDADVLGIDLGIGLLMAENLRSGLVWKTFMGNAEARVAMERVGFRAST